MVSQSLVQEPSAPPVRRRSGGYAESLDAWLGTGAQAFPVAEVTQAGAGADWSAPGFPVTLSYDTADHAFPVGVRAVVQEGTRRLMFETAEYEILLRVAPNRTTQRYHLAGQILFEGLPLPGAVVRVDEGGPAATTSTDHAGGFQLPPLLHGACHLRVAVDGAVLNVPPIALH